MFAQARMDDGYVTMEIDGSKWAIHLEDWDWALAKVSADTNRPFEMCKAVDSYRKMVSLLFHFGRRISPAIA